MNIRFKFILFVVFHFIFFNPVKASESVFELTKAPSTIVLEKEFQVEASISGLPQGNRYHLRIVLYKEGKTEYLGSTFSDEVGWYNGTPTPIDYSKYYSIQIKEDGSWSGIISGKVEYTDPKYTEGPGLYKLKLGRYTDTGSTATWAETTIKDVELKDLNPTSTNSPTPSPTSSPTPTLTHTPTPTKVNTPTPTPSPTMTPVSTATPTRKPTATPTTKPTVTKVPTPTNAFETAEETAVESMPAVLGESTTAENTPTPTVIKSSTPNNLPKIFIGTGALFLVISGGLFIYLNVKH